MPEVKRPQFRNIHVTDIVGYRLPPAGIVSILHRISGLLMFVLLPFILYLLENSLTSEDTFIYLTGIVQMPLVKLVLVALVWAYVRHLIMDVHVGLDKHSAKTSALIVLGVSVALAALVALKIFGVF